MPEVGKIKLAIIGGGGHGRVVADAANLAGFNVGFILPDGTDAKLVFGYPVLGRDSDIRDLALEHSFVVAIGDNWQRAAIVKRVCSQAPYASFARVIHPSATVSKHTVLGMGTVVLAQAVVNSGAKMGEHCIVNTGAVVEHDNVLGTCASLGPRAVTGGTARVGDYTAVCIGATVLPGVSIGSHAIVGAGALVTRDLPDAVVAYGTPARIVRNRQEGDPYL